MIQRVQTIYLLLAALALASTLFMPFATIGGAPTSLAVAGDNYFSDGAYWAVEIPGGMVVPVLAILAVLGIFMYKNRPRQMQITAATALLALLGVLALLGMGFQHAQRLPAGAVAQWFPGSVVPAFAVVLLLLAYRAIRKDEALVRSSDRLR
ncbi:MAG: DUF4293 domain-containing protein [Saprospiraceae bacterium]|nr:DUF4293 domain-containing protein [Saprospiraceae bacterium]